MRAYTDFAKVYPLMMQDIPYDAWNKYIIKTLKKYGIRDGIVCELGCGTGEMTRRLSKAGFDMIGIDISSDMLEMAASYGDTDILYLNQDMREFELYGTVRAVVSVCDSMNYLTEDGDLLQVLKLVNNYLDPGGIFICDLKTPHFYRDILRDETFAEDLGSVYYIWDNHYDRESRINEYDMTFFFKNETGYRKSSEVHIQRAYTLREIRQAVNASGMELLDIIDAETKEEVTRKTVRINVIAREHGK